MVVLITLILVLVVMLNAFQDDIVHHDSYKHLGKFFSKESEEAPKKSLFHSYFPMFFDAWHLSKFIQYILYAMIVGIVGDKLWYFPVSLTGFCLIFIAAYQYND